MEQARQVARALALVGFGLGLAFALLALPLIAIAAKSELAPRPTALVSPSAIQTSPSNPDRLVAREGR